MARSADSAGRQGAKVMHASSAGGPGLTFINAQMAGRIGRLRVVGPRIAAIDEKAGPGERVVDLRGDRLLPGLINAHDHLQLNSLPRRDVGKRFSHVREWISEVDSSRRSDPSFEAGVAVLRDERLLIGGVKNLLSGVTTVAHHDPLYRFLLDDDYPTQVVREYGWSHSLYVESEQEVRRSHRRTSSAQPWIIHAAEGLNDEAHDEFSRLDALGCLRRNTLLVHGIALDHAQRCRLRQTGGGLIWCPSSNLRLFGKTAQVAELQRHGRVALGTDSRLSGARDLLDELRIASAIGGFDEGALEALVTRDSARLLRLPDRGVLRAGARADILILPNGAPLATARRADVRLVLIDGIVRYGDRDCARCVEPGAEWTDVRVDGVPKIIDSRIAGLLSKANAHETGLELPTMAWRVA